MKFYKTMNEWQVDRIYEIDIKLEQGGIALLMCMFFVAF